MKENCLDIGTIQAFLDRELSPAESTRVSTHVAGCDSCALMLSQAEDESALVFSALEREFDTLVPTQRLWGRINTAIETERREAPFWQKVLAFVRTSLANPSLAAAASIILVIGVAAFYWMNRPTPVTETPRNDVARDERPMNVSAPAPVATTAPVARNNDAPAAVVERASYHPPQNPVSVKPAAAKSQTGVTSVNEYMPGEDSYVKTIANLTKSVEQKKDDVMRPSERVAYERDMAVVDDAIAKMRKEVKKNPKNDSARQVLYSSYQNKIDLLNSVSQREELMASVR